MSLRTVFYVGLAAGVLALCAPGCGGDDDDDDKGAGGTPAAGGSGTAGTDGNAGDPATGPTEEALFDFDSDDEDVEILDYEGGTANGIKYVNVGHAPDREQYMSLEPDVAPDVAWSNAEGADGEPGVIELTAPFDGYNQAVDLQWVFSSPIDMSGRILIARIQVIDDGGYVQGTGASGGGTVFAKSGEEWVYGRGGWYTLEQDDYGTWIEFEFELDIPDEANAGFDPTLIRAVGVQISTGGAEGNTAPTPATVQVDQITLYTP